MGDAGQTMIKNLPRRGYILATPVSETERTAGVQPTPVTEVAGHASRGDPREASLPRLSRTRAVAVVILSVVLIGAAIWFAFPRPRATTERASIAVLPFTNLAGDPNQDYLGEGISAEITASLSKFAQLLVVAEGSSSRYTGGTTYFAGSDGRSAFVILFAAAFSVTAAGYALLLNCRKLPPARRYGRSNMTASSRAFSRSRMM